MTILLKINWKYQEQNYYLIVDAPWRHSIEIKVFSLSTEVVHVFSMVDVDPAWTTGVPFYIAADAANEKSLKEFLNARNAACSEAAYHGKPIDGMHALYLAEYNIARQKIRGVLQKP